MPVTRLKPGTSGMRIRSANGDAILARQTIWKIFLNEISKPVHDIKKQHETTNSPIQEFKVLQNVFECL